MLWYDDSFRVFIPAVEVRQVVVNATQIESTIAALKDASAVLSTWGGG